MIVTVHVGVCIERPPKTDEIVRVRVSDVATELEGELVACQIACGSHKVQMPVWSRVVEINEL